MKQTKGTVTLKHCAVHKQFITHSYWEVIRWTKRLSFSYSTVPTEWDIGSDSPRNSVFTPPYFKAEAVRKSSRQLQVLPGKNHLLFVVETYHTFTFSSFVFSLSNSQAQPMSTVQRPPKSTMERCQDGMSHAFVPLALPDELLRSRWSSQVDACSSTTN